MYRYLAIAGDPLSAVRCAVWLIAPLFLNRYDVRGTFELQFFHLADTRVDDSSPFAVCYNMEDTMVQPFCEATTAVVVLPSYSHLHCPLAHTTSCCNMK